MCGIIGYVGHQDCVPILLDGLRRLEYRGYDSAGIACWTGDDIAIRRAQGKLIHLQRVIAPENLHSNLGMGHTRWATHGRPSEQNAHPHRWASVALVHNGIIENYLSLRHALEARGHHFDSETDTEIVAHLIGERVEEGLDLHTAVRAVLQQIQGSYALVVLSAKEPDRLVIARQQSPLVIALGPGESFAASDIPAILGHSREVLFLEDGESAILTAAGVSLFDPEGTPIERQPRRINWDPISAEKQGYKHFMLKEIHEQPDKIIDTLRGRILLDQGDVNLDGLHLPHPIQRILLVACGTSYHAALVGKFLIEALARIPVDVDVASEFRYRTPLLGPQQLFVAISQSGETADTLAALRLAKEMGAFTLSVCNVMEASIPRAAHDTLYTRADPEIGVASTKAFTTQLTALLLLAVHLGRRNDALAAATAKSLLVDLRRVPALIDNVLAQQEHLRAIAKDFMHARSFLYLGRGVNYPIALEGALKLKEISYIHAEGYPAGEMKHGPIALIDEDLPVVVIAPRGHTFDKVASNLQEVRARGGRVIAIVTADDPHLRDPDIRRIEIPDLPDHLQPLLTIIPLQMLAYHIADLKGTDIDQPRNLAKSVTVE